MTKLRSVLIWVAAAVLAVFGIRTLWDRKRKVRAAKKAFDARVKVIREERKAAALMLELDQEVIDARSDGTLADRFNE